MSIRILPIPALKDNYIWAIVEEGQHKAFIVDPGEASPVMQFLKQHDLELSGILITHHHWDHTNGIAELKRVFDVPVFGPGKEGVAGVTQTLQGGTTISLPDFPLALQVIDIPGHTLGHIAFYAKGLLFCGDTLFAAGCGRTFEGTASQMLTSLRTLANHPDDTKVYCAHEYTLNNLRFAELVEPGNSLIAARMRKVDALRKAHQPTLPSTLGEEKATNPFLRCDSPEVIKSVEKYAGKRLDNEVDVFAWLRKWKDEF